MLIPFSKYQGTGNDFILIDNRDKTFPLETVDIPKLCHRQYGIGADGLILLQSDQKADYSMRIFNSDGGEAEMCGNGLRCLVDFLHVLGEKKKCVNITAIGGTYECTWQKEGVRVKMGLPQIDRLDEGDFLVNAGVPHLVFFVDDLSRFDKEAKKRFSVSGVNINYAKIIHPKKIAMRTFERGVEDETLSCGTGATAVCMAASKKFGVKGLIDVEFHSRGHSDSDRPLIGEALTFDLLVKNEILEEIYMIGKVSHVFNGEVWV